jgi:hypothetical protein
MHLITREVEHATAASVLTVLWRHRPPLQPPPPKTPGGSLGRRELWALEPRWWVIKRHPQCYKQKNDQRAVNRAHSPQRHTQATAQSCAVSSLLLLRNSRISRWGSAGWWRGTSTSLVWHHRASLWLPSFSEACMKAASLQPRVSLPETSSLRC